MTEESTASSSSKRHKHGQLYCPKPGSMAGAIALLEKSNLTEQDVRDYLDGKVEYVPKPLSRDEERFMERRKQIVEWASQVESGGAQIDANHRLVPNRGPDPLLPIPQVGQQPPDDNNNMHAGGAPPGIAALLENEEEERRWLEREEREAAEVIARTVKCYRDEGVPEDNFVLIPVLPLRRHGDAASLTFRRICFAVLAVVTAFICIMLQTLPLFTTVKPSDPIFDKLLPELLHVRDFSLHARYCHDLHRDRDSFQSILLGNASPIDCSDGVLHIPAVSVLRHDTKRRAPNSEEALVLKPYSNGVNVSWIMPCDTPADEAAQTRQYTSTACFRGVHDGWLSDSNVEDALRMGAALVQKEGADHFDIHDNVAILHKSVPHLVQRVHNLLEQLYFNGTTRLEPVAFRVQVALPMDADDVRGKKSSNLLGQIINRTNYIEWLEATKRHNEDVLYSLTPFPPKPIRDTCNILADMEANSSFAVHTSIFLSNGAGGDYQGGVSLYVDNDYKQNPRRRIRRGVTIDGSRGRIVVSTGGRENRRCRLPTRAGIRAVLQIWWNERPKAETNYCDDSAE